MVQLQKDSNRLYIYTDTPTGFLMELHQYFFGFESIEEVSNRKQNKKHQSSRKYDCSYTFMTTGHYLASTYVVSQHLGRWPETILPVTRQEAAGWGTSNPSWRQQEGGLGWTVLPRLADSWWRCGRRQPPSRPKRPSWKKPRWEEKVRDWNHEMQFLFVSVFAFVGYCFFCVVYVCHLRKKPQTQVPKILRNSRSILDRSELLGTQKEVMEVLSSLDCSRWKRGKTAEEMGGWKVKT